MTPGRLVRCESGVIGVSRPRPVDKVHSDPNGRSRVRMASDLCSSAFTP